MRRWTFGLLLVAACGANKGPAPASSPVASSSATAAKPSAGASICTATSKSAGAGPDVVARVEVRGATRLTVADVCDRIQTKAGEVADVASIQADLKRLWKSGEIDDVFVSSEDSALGRVLTYEVRERPNVKAWHVDGCKALDGAQVRERFGPAGQALNPAAVNEILTRIRADYAALGYRSAIVQQRVENAGPLQVDVYVSVTEGPVATIRGIELTGAPKAHVAPLLALIETGAGTYNTVGKLYRPDALEADRFKMLSWLFDRGMVTASIEPEKVGLSEDRTSIDVVIGVTEGPVYKVNRVSFQGKLDAPESKYLELLGARKGQVFSRGELLKGMERIQEFEKAAGRHGTLNPKTELDPKKLTIDLTIEIQR